MRRLSLIFTKLRTVEFERLKLAALKHLETRTRSELKLANVLELPTDTTFREKLSVEYEKLSFVKTGTRDGQLQAKCLFAANFKCAN